MMRALIFHLCVARASGLARNAAAAALSSDAAVVQRGTPGYEALLEKNWVGNFRIRQRQSHCAGISRGTPSSGSRRAGAGTRRRPRPQLYARRRVQRRHVALAGAPQPRAGLPRADGGQPRLDHDRRRCHVTMRRPISGAAAWRWRHEWRRPERCRDPRRTQVHRSNPAPRRARSLAKLALVPPVHGRRRDRHGNARLWPPHTEPRR
jgi:hypothetical protein